MHARRAGCKQYSTAIDIWSLGCIMAELLTKKVLFQGTGELDQIDKIFKVLGSPTEETWPGHKELDNVKKVTAILAVACLTQMPAQHLAPLWHPRLMLV